MSVVSGIVVYLLIWWVVLFTILPIGVRQQSGGVDEGIKGAPENPLLVKKFIITTLISFAVWGIVYGLIKMDVISFREMAKGM